MRSPRSRRCSKRVARCREGAGNPDARYYERLRALEAGGWWNAAMRDILESVTDAAGLPDTGMLVDIGCGSGGTLDWFARRHPRWHCAGIDIAMDGLRAVPALPKGGAIQASALDVPVATASADFVIALDVLQHLPLDGGDIRALGEMRRHSEAWRSSVRAHQRAGVPRTADDGGFQFHRYETAELRGKLAAAGFVVHRLSRVNAVLGLAEIPREWRALRATGRAYHGVLLAAAPIRTSLADRWKRRWLRAEGRLALRGWPLPFGRTHLAICRADAGRVTSASSEPARPGQGARPS